MKTQIIHLDRNHIDEALAKRAGTLLAAGGVVAIPTETVYGLGASAYDVDAVHRVFAAKGRPSDNPLIVHVADKEMVYELATEVSAQAKLVMQHFWPGPISIIVKKSDRIPDVISAGLDTVAIRMPSHPVALSVIRYAGIPVAAPSANLSGKPSPTTAAHVVHDLMGKIDMIVDGGDCLVGLESTVLDVSGGTPVILRPGGISAQQLRAVLGEVDAPPVIGDVTGVPKCPGMKYKHYAPEAEVHVIEYVGEFPENELRCLVVQAHEKNRRVGVLSDDQMGNIVNADVWLFAGNTSEEYAAHLFDSLRSFDLQGTDLVYCPISFADGLGVAIRNRLYKAAAGRIHKLNR